MLTYLTTAIIASAAFLGGVVLMWVRRDDRLREAERSALASVTACANKELECERLDARLWEAEAEINRLRAAGGGPEAAQ